MSRTACPGLNRKCQHLYFTMKQKIAILGATGRTGQCIVREALRRGYAVNALVRDKNRLPLLHDDLFPVEGYPTSREALSRTLEGCTAVLSALNISRVQEWWPWSKLSAPETFLSDVAKELVAVAEEKEIKRILVITAWGTSETRSQVPGWFRFITDNSKIGVTYRDHERQEEAWEASSLYWTIVRPVGLTNDPQDRPIKVWLETATQQPKLTISRRMVADFMLDALEHNRYIRQKPIIAYL
jgi:putative NADH-flavin reductase